MKTLIVENDRVSAILLRRLLEQQGHEVTLVETGTDAWQRLRAGSYGLVLAASAMPGMDGLDLTRRIRAGGDAATYIVLVSSRDRSDDRISGLEAGADDFLSKPFDREEVFGRIFVAERLMAMKTALTATSTKLAHTQAELVRLADVSENYVDELRTTCRNLEAAHVQLKATSITDGLTGLKNHREFQERLDDEINRASRYNLPLSLIMLDVDHFKRFNDTYGHPAGDEVLKTLAKILSDHARDSDVLARYGGEEFALILANTDREHAMAAAERFRAAIEREPWPHQPVTASMGVSTLRLIAQTRADLTTEADMALYACKSQGRNCVMHFGDVREPA